MENDAVRQKLTLTGPTESNSYYALYTNAVSKTCREPVLSSSMRAINCESGFAERFIS
jgi:hypothetical protein